MLSLQLLLFEILSLQLLLNLMSLEKPLINKIPIQTHLHFYLVLLHQQFIKI